MSAFLKTAGEAGWGDITLQSLIEDAELCRRALYIAARVAFVANKPGYNHAAQLYNHPDQPNPVFSGPQKKNDFNPSVRAVSEFTLTAQKVGWSNRQLTNLTQDHKLCAVVMFLAAGTLNVDLKAYFSFKAALSPSGFVHLKPQSDGPHNVHLASLSVGNTGTADRAGYSGPGQEPWTDRNPPTQSLVNFLVENAFLIPEKWKDYGMIAAPGTLYRCTESSDPDNYCGDMVPALYWAGDGWQAGVADAYSPGNVLIIE